MDCAQFPPPNRPDSSLRQSFGSVFDCVSMVCNMDGPFRPYVQRYVTILVKITEQKTEHFASRDLCAQQGGCGEKPCSPRCPRTPSRLGTGIGVPISPKYCWFRRKISEQQKKHIREIIGNCKFRDHRVPPGPVGAEWSPARWQEPFGMLWGLCNESRRETSLFDPNRRIHSTATGT